MECHTINIPFLEVHNLFLSKLESIIVVLSMCNHLLLQKLYTVFAEIFGVVLISDVTFIMKFKKLNNWRCRGQHAKLARLFRN